MKKQLLLLGYAVFPLFACVGCKTHVPMVQHEPEFPNYQRKAEAVEHWRRMATEICDGIAGQQAKFGNAIYLQQLPYGASEFDLAYWKMLRVQLVNSAWQVVPVPQASHLHLSIESQLVAHGNRGFYFNATTIWGKIGLGVLNSLTGDETGNDRSTSGDLLVTALLTQDGVPVVGATQIVYVPPGDAHLYSTQQEFPQDPFGQDWTIAEHNALSMR